jgi:protein-S-isoprenylcysteine O-methyltransferase Ste14
VIITQEQLPLAALIRPYVQTQPAVLALWLTANLVSAGFEFKQWLQRRAEATKSDEGSLGLLLTCAGLGLTVLVLAPTIAPSATIRPAPLAFAVGIVVFLAGFAMRRWSETTLGRYFTFTVMTAADQPVITAGPYRFVRHPGYTGVMLVVVGSGLVTGNWLGLGAWTLLVLAPLLYRIHIEENALLAALGDRYSSYAAQHKRLMPLIW